MFERAHSRLHVRLRDVAQRVIRLGGGVTLRDLEYDFAHRHVVGATLKILDVGGCDSRLALRFARAGHDVTVYDYRRYPERHPNIQSIQGDFLENDLPSDEFDYVVLVSTIEHIGFGGYGAPKRADGDFKAMAEALRVLEPSGRVVLTFPFASRETHIDGFERWYDLNRVRRLFRSLHVLAEEYCVPGVRGRVLGRVTKWLPASAEQITSKADVVEAYGRQCNAFYVVSPSPRSVFS